MIDVTTRTAGIVHLRDGLELPYVEQGNVSGTPIVLLHGYPDSLRSYEPLLAHLPAGLRAVAVTQRGHGDASRPATGYGIGDFAADLDPVLDELGIASAILVGHSMGSMIAQRFALDRPDRVLGLVLIGALVNGGANAVLREVEGMVAGFEGEVDPAFVREFQVSTLAQPAPAAFVETVIAESSKVPVRVWKAALAGIAAPTLVVWGARDELATRAEQDLLVSALPRAVLPVHPGAGHSVHWEEPTAVAAEIAAFAARIVA
jgi:non-heme chloroperoxidase